MKYLKEGGYYFSSKHIFNDEKSALALSTKAGYIHIIQLPREVFANEDLENLFVVQKKKYAEQMEEVLMINALILRT